MNKILLVLLSFIFLQLQAYASNVEKDKQTIKPYKKHKIILLSDNDAYTNPYTDNYYTAGHRILYISPEWDFHNEDNTSKASWLGKISIYPYNNVTNYFVSISQEIYTPKDKIQNAGHNDYPYSGSLYLSLGINQRRDVTFERLWLDIGIVGKHSFAEQVQDSVHSSINAENNQALPWNSQVGDEFIINLHYSYSGKVPLVDNNIAGIHLIPTGQLSLGNASTFFDINMRLKIGHNLNASFGIPKVNFGPDFTGVISNDFSLYVYGGAGCRFVARNIYIQGNSWEHPYRHKIIPVVYYFESGICLAYKGFELAYGITYKGKEFYKQADEHLYGTIMISFAI